MAGFGGSVKLTGESEYRKALQQITTDLKTMSTALKTQTVDFNSNDKSIKNTATSQKQLNDTIQKQQQAINVAKSSLSGYTVEMQKQTTLHNQLNKEYKNAVLELDRVKKSSGETSAEYKKQAQVVDQLEKKLVESQSKLDENKEAMASLKKEINNSQKAIDTAKNSLDNLDKELQDTEKSTKSAGDGFTVFKGILANLGTQAINSAINGLKKLGSAMINVGKKAISSYAEFEQLAGGVESMFGGTEKGAEQINKVMELSKKAWKDLTLSQSDYITAFNSTYPLMKNDIEDQNEAIEKTNRIMTLNSDLANTFGYSMDQASTAINWALKGTFSYLDNLNIGIKGTKEGFLEAAKSVGYTVKSVDELSSSDILDILEKCADRYGVLGKTADEANKTIQGSTKMVKSAWENLLTGIADGNQEIGPLIKNFVDSVAVAWENLKPRIKEAIKGIKDAIGELWKNRGQFKEDFPELAPIINAFEWIIDNKELIIGSITAILSAFAIGKVASFVNTMVTLGTTLAGIPAVAGVASTAMTALGGAFTFMTGPIGIAITAIGAIVGAIALLWNKSESFREFWKGLWENLKEFVSTGVEHIVSFFSELPEKMWGILTSAYEKITNWGISVGTKATEIGRSFVNNTVDFIKELPSKIWNFLTNTIQKVVSFANNIGAKAKEAGQNVVDAITGKIKNLPNQMLNWGKDMIQGLVNGIKSMINKVGDAVKGVANKIKNFLHFSRPDTGPLREYEEWMPDMIEGLTTSLEKSSPELINGIKNLSSEMENALHPNLGLNGLNLNETSSGNINTLNNFNSLVEAFKTALSDMKMELDGEQMGKFVDKTVADAIFN